MPLPTFLAAGGRRCGTTSLYYWIQDHPQVFLYPQRDTNFFVDDCLKSPTWVDVKAQTAEWDLTHTVDAYAARFNGSEGRAAVGEKCADLLFWRPTHPRLARFLPDCRYIVILRHPAERAWSHYWHEVGKSREPMPFEQALAAEDQRVAASDYGLYHLSYRRRGYYDESLTSFFSHIAPARVLVLIFEEVMRDPAASMRQLYEFIGVDPNLGLSRAGSQHHENWAAVARPWTQWPGLRAATAGYRSLVAKAARRLARGGADPLAALDRERKWIRIAETPIRKPAAKIAMRADTRSRLMQDFLPHTRALETILGRELKEWR